jgi:hypothetical protein
MSGLLCRVHLEVLARMLEPCREIVPDIRACHELSQTKSTCVRRLNQALACDAVAISVPRLQGCMFRELTPTFIGVWALFVGGCEPTKCGLIHQNVQQCPALAASFQTYT